MTIIQRRKNSRGFTLIEIMVVVAIIVILVGIGVAVGTYVKTSSQLRLTKTTLASLQGAMATFVKNNPEPPAPTGNPLSTTWFQALRADPSTVNVLKGLPGFNDGAILDGYGGIIVYHPSSSNVGTGALVQGGYFISPGPDGKLGTSDDILSDVINP